MLRLKPRFTRHAALPLLLALACGCSALDNCPDGKPDITIETGVTVEDARTYASAPLGGPRDAFPAKTTLHFAHQLGFTPETVKSFVSFVPEGPWSENAGNQGEWRCVDDEELVLHNGTCEDFHVVVTAYGSGTQHAPCKCAERREDGACPDP
jgi:hypothetical protein